MHSVFSNLQFRSRPAGDVRCRAHRVKESLVHPVVEPYRNKNFDPDDLELLSHLVPDLHIALRVQERDAGSTRRPRTRRERTQTA